MAELTNNSGQNSGRVKRLQAPRVDLTAMVDLAFLLITFFMLTTTLAKPHVMGVVMPVQDADPGTVSEMRTVTICLGRDDKLEWYKGTLTNPLIAPIADNYSGIRKALLEQSQKVFRDTGKGLIVIIKPTEGSNYKNLVDILDEMKITQVPTYSIADISKAELEMMKKEQVY